MSRCKEMETLAGVRWIVHKATFWNGDVGPNSKMKLWLGCLGGRKH